MRAVVGLLLVVVGIVGILALPVVLAPIELVAWWLCASSIVVGIVNVWRHGVEAGWWS